MKPITPILCRGSECVELYLHSPIYLHCVVLHLVDGQLCTYISTYLLNLIHFPVFSQLFSFFFQIFVGGGHQVYLPCRRQWTISTTHTCLQQSVNYRCYTWPSTAFHFQWGGKSHFPFKMLIQAINIFHCHHKNWVVTDSGVCLERYLRISLSEYFIFFYCRHPNLQSGTASVASRCNSFPTGFGFFAGGKKWDSGVLGW